MQAGDKWFLANIVHSSREANVIHAKLNSVFTLFVIDRLFRL